MYIRGFDDIGEGRTDVIFSKKKNCLVQEVSTTHTLYNIYIYMYIIARAVYATRIRAYNISLHTILLYTLSRRRTAEGGQKSEFYYSVDGDEGGLFFSFFFFFNVRHSRKQIVSDSGKVPF